MLQVLRDPSSRGFWLARLASNTGDQFYNIAMVWLAMRLGGAPVVAWVGLAEMAAVLALGPYAGHLSDRLGCRRVMVAADAVRGLATAAVPALAGTGLLTVPALLAVSALIGAGGAVFGPAMWSAIANLQRRGDWPHEAGTALFDAAPRLGRLIGPACAGILLSVLPLPQLLLGDAVSYGLSLLAALRILGLDGESPGRRRLPTARMGEAMRWISRRPDMLSMLGVRLVCNVFLAGFTVGVPVWLAARGAGAAAFALLVGARAAGNGLSLLTLAPRPWPNRRAAYGLGWLGTGLALAVLPLVPPGWPAAVVMAGGGVLAPIHDVTILTFMQRAAPPAILGKVVSLAGLAYRVGAALGLMLAGVFAKAVPPAAFVGGSGVAIAAVALAMLAGSLRAVPRAVADRA